MIGQRAEHTPWALENRERLRVEYEKPGPVRYADTGASPLDVANREMCYAAGSLS